MIERVALVLGAWLGINVAVVALAVWAGRRNEAHAAPLISGSSQVAYGTFARARIACDCRTGTL